jgi:hypothetical protein
MESIGNDNLETILERIKKASALTAAVLVSLLLFVYTLSTQSKNPMFLPVGVLISLAVGYIVFFVDLIAGYVDRFVTNH